MRSSDNGALYEKLQPIIKPMINATLVAKPDDPIFFMFEWLCRIYEYENHIIKEREELENLRIFYMENIGKGKPYKKRKEILKLNLQQDDEEVNFNVIKKGPEALKVEENKEDINEINSINEEGGVRSAKPTEKSEKTIEASEESDEGSVEISDEASKEKSDNGSDKSIEKSDDDDDDLSSDSSDDLSSDSSDVDDSKKKSVDNDKNGEKSSVENDKNGEKTSED